MNETKSWGLGQPTFCVSQPNLKALLPADKWEGFPSPVISCWLRGLGAQTTICLLNSASCWEQEDERCHFCSQWNWRLKIWLPSLLLLKYYCALRLGGLRAKINFSSLMFKWPETRSSYESACSARVIVRSSPTCRLWTCILNNTGAPQPFVCRIRSFTCH